MYLFFSECNVDELGGGAGVYLSSLRVNIAEESVVDHRVQLQCKFDEKEGKYTEAKPRCTCPSYESNLHQVGEVFFLFFYLLSMICPLWTDSWTFMQHCKSLDFVHALKEN